VEFSEGSYKGTTADFAEHLLAKFADAAAPRITRAQARKAALPKTVLAARSPNVDAKRAPPKKSRRRGAQNERPADVEGTSRPPLPAENTSDGPSVAHVPSLAPTDAVGGGLPSARVAARAPAPPSDDAAATGARRSPPRTDWADKVVFASAFPSPTAGKAARKKVKKAVRHSGFSDSEDELPEKVCRPKKKKDLFG